MGNDVILKLLGAFTTKRSFMQHTCHLLSPPYFNEILYITSTFLTFPFSPFFCRSAEAWDMK